MALIIVLSVYNGIGRITQDLFNVFDPELKIEPARGKTLNSDSVATMIMVAGVERVMPVVEENAWVTNGEHEAIVSLRGVDSSYGATTGLDTMLYKGVYVLKARSSYTDAEGGYSEERDDYFLVLGGELYAQLCASLMSNRPMAVHIPKRGQAIGMTMDQAFNTGYAAVSGTFYLQQEVDARYAIADIDFVRRLLDYADGVSTSLSVILDGSRSVAAVKAELSQQLGPRYAVKDRYDQQPLYYKIFRSERIGIILILSLIVLIATLNLVASLSLLIIDKRRDIAVMRSMGMEEAVIRRAFFVEGLLISGVGIVAGLVLGFVVCFVQQQYGIVRLGDNFIVDAFPVAMRWIDFVVTFVLVAALCSLSVLATVRRVRLR